jgi:hypothetical protein
VKHQCISNQFIAINDNLEVDARVLHQTIRMGKRARQWRNRERVCVRDSVSLKVKDSVGLKMDSCRKHLEMDMCD